MVVFDGTTLIRKLPKRRINLCGFEKGVLLIGSNEWSHLTVPRATYDLDEGTLLLHFGGQDAAQQLSQSTHTTHAATKLWSFSSVNMILSE